MRSIEMRDVFQTLFAVAWADGELREDERTLLSDLIQRSEVGGEVGHWFDEAPDEPNWGALKDNAVAASAIMRQAMHMAAADQSVQYEETLLLERLRKKLGLSEQQLASLQREVEQQRD